MRAALGKVRLNSEESEEWQRRKDEQVQKQQTNRNRDSRVIEGQEHEKMVTDEVDCPSFLFSLVTKP